MTNRPLAKTKTVFLDHNILSKLHDKQLTCELIISDLPELLIKHNLKLVLTVFSLYEISKCTDKKVIKICHEIEKCSPYFLLTAIDIQIKEINKFLLDEDEPVEAIMNSMTEYFMEVEGSREIVTSSLSKHCLDLPNHIQQYNENLDEWMTSGNLITRNCEKLKNKNINDQLYRLRVKDFLALICKDDKSSCQNYFDKCVHEKESFLKKCPAVFVEEMLFEKRFSDGKRKLKKSDAPDIQNAIVAMAYCDYFVTEDKYLKECIKYVLQTNKSNHINLAQLKDLSDFC